MALGVIEIPSKDGREHENESHYSVDEPQRRSVKDGGASEEGPAPLEILTSLTLTCHEQNSQIGLQISGSATYTDFFLELTAKVQDDDPLKTISEVLGIVEEMIRMKRMTREEYLKAMPIIPTSKEITVDKAAKFASEIGKLSVELCNNELSPASIGEFFVQADDTSLLNGGLQSILGRRAFETVYEERFKNTPFGSAE